MHLWHIGNNLHQKGATALTVAGLDEKWTSIYVF